MLIYNKTNFCSKRIISLKKVIFLLDINTHPHCDLKARSASQYFCMTLQPMMMMMHHHTKFGNKKADQFRRYLLLLDKPGHMVKQTYNIWIWCFLPTYMLKQFGLWARLCFVIATIHAGVHDLVHCRTYFDFQPPAQHWWCSNHNQHYHHICTWYIYILSRYKKTEH